MHEYGHVLQSERTGIAFPVNYGIPSIFSAIKDRNNPDHDHESYRTETSANRWARRYFEWYGVDWNDFVGQYPLR